MVIWRIRTSSAGPWKRPSSVRCPSHSLKAGLAFERVQSNGVGGGSPNGMVVFGLLSGFLTNQPTPFSANLPGSGNPIGLHGRIGTLSALNSPHFSGTESRRSDSQLN